MSDVYVLSCPAFSIVKVSKQLAKVLNAKLMLGYFKPQSVSGAVIIVGNPHLWERRLYYSVKTWGKPKEFIFYITLEGNIRRNFLPMIQWLNDGTIITPSHYAREKLEEAGFYVTDVIPHGVEVYGEAKTRNNKTFGYIAGYLKRKYPKYGVEAVKEFNVKVITTSNNPYLKYFDVVTTREYDENSVPDQMIYDFYRKIAFYVNLSDAEGFGLTPLEALAFGTPVIAPRYPPLTEFLPSFTLWVDVTGEVWYENWGNWLDIEHHEYSSDSMRNRIIEAINMNDKEYHRLSSKCLEHAREYDIYRVYSRFKKMV